MATQIRMVENDNARSIVFDLLLNGAGEDLATATLRCHMRERSTGVERILSTVTADSDQIANPGRVATVFNAADLVVGTYTLEWEATVGSAITTYPGDASQRPLMIVRAEAG